MNPFEALVRVVLLSVALVPAGSAVAVDLEPGDILVADIRGRVVLVVDPSTGDREVLSSRSLGIGEGAFMRNPRDVAVGPNGEIYVLEDFTERVLQIQPQTGDRRQIGGQALLNPRGIAVDAAGSILIADVSTVQRMDPETGETTVVSGEGVGRGFRFGFARGVAVESDGSIIVTDAPAFSGRVFRVDPQTGDRTVVSSASVGTGPLLHGGARVAVLPNGDIVVATFNDGTLFRIDPRSGNRATYSPSSGGGVFAVTLGLDGSLVSGKSGTIVRTDPLSGEHEVISDPLTGEGALFSVGPRGLAVYPMVDFVAASQSCHRVRRRSTDPALASFRLTTRDRFGVEPTTYRMTSYRDVCVPAAVEGMGNADPEATLTCYRASRAAGPADWEKIRQFTRERRREELVSLLQELRHGRDVGESVLATDAFGEHALAVGKLTSLCVPSEIRLESEPAPAVGLAGREHFACYGVDPTTPTPERIEVEAKSTFSPSVSSRTLRDVTELCVAADESNEDLVDPDNGLTCYSFARPPRFRWNPARQDVLVENPFGAEQQLRVSRENRFCTPAEVAPLR